ncbi:UNVERIFIED_CONTAM: hypothetical protein Sindi_1257500 [Sesamum indicum]
MVVIRADRHLKLPPPAYHPETESITVAVYYGGELRNMPVAACIGGKLQKFDYVNVTHMNRQNLELFAEKCGVSGEGIRFYIIKNGGFKLLFSDEDILEQALDHMKSREFTVYIEHTPPEPNEVAVETGPVRGKKGKTKAKGKGKGKGKGKVMEKKKGKTKVADDDDIVFLGVVGGGNDMNAETRGEEDDEINNETEAGGVGIFEENVEFLDNENDIGIDSGSNDAEEDNSENESIDMVASENDLDEHRQSDDEENGPNFVAFNPDQMYDPALELGMIFSSKKEFKKAVQSHAIKNKRTVKFTKNDSFRVYAVCSGEGCEWKIHATKLKNEQTFQVNLYKDEHTCPQVFKVKNVKTSWLSERYLQDFKSDPKKCVKGWRVDIMNQLRCHVSRDQAYRAKREALKKLEGSPEYQFTKLWDYAEELRKTNPGSTVILGINDENGQNRFEKFYVCFSTLKQGILGGCRPVICVDGCHLKGPHKGILLTAVGVDPNNNLYPIAYAVVQRESTDTWEWFLTVLKQDVCIQRDSEYTFMSNKQKGLVQAFQSVFPNAAHRFCVRHLHNNFKNAGFRGLAYKNAMWKAPRASTVEEFKLRMEEIKKLDEKAFDWLNEKPPSDFNANIMDARDKPILTMLEWIREYLMRRLQENREKASKKWKGTLCPKIKKLLQKHIDKIGDCIPIKANDRYYQISCYDGSQFSVDLERRTCTCRLWQLSGIPCKHACSAIFNQNLQPEEMAETGFIPPLPPNFGRGPGRPAGARNREPDEDKDMQEPGLDEIQMNTLFSKAGSSSTSNTRKRRHSVYEDPNRVTMPATNSGVNDPATILPPIVEQHEPMQHDLEPEILTEPGPTPTLPCVQGPTMYEQLQMTNANMSFQPQVTLQPRLNIRAPPPMTGTSFMPCFSSRPIAPISKTIVKEHGRKWVDISKWPSQSSDDHGQK